MDQHEQDNLNARLRARALNSMTCERCGRAYADPLAHKCDENDLIRQQRRAVRSMPPTITCDNCHLTYYQTGAPHVCAGDDGKRYLLAERVRFHRLLVAVKAMRQRHQAEAKKANFNDCGCDDCLLLGPIVTAIESQRRDGDERKNDGY